MKKQYPLVDIFKLIFAISILAVHSNVFLGENNTSWFILHGFCRLGVPFFFVASGFFLAISLKKNNGSIDIVKKYIKRLLVPFVFWVLLNFIPLFITWRHEPISTIALKTVQNLLLYPCGAMWYILALMISSILTYPFYKKKKLPICIIISAILYIFALLCNNYYFLIENTFVQGIIDNYLNIAVSARNGIFEGLLFVSIGMYIYELLNNNKINFKINNFILVISYILLILEIIFIKGNTYMDDHSLFISFYTLIPSFFIFLLQFGPNIDTLKARNYSTGIYFSHRFLLMFAKTLALYIGISNILVFISVLIIDLIILTILYKIDNKNINKLIK